MSGSKRSRPRIRGSVALVLLLACVAACRGRSGGEATGGGKHGAAATDPAAAGPGASVATGEILLLFPAADDSLLHLEKRSVVPLAAPEDRAKQALAELFRGPSPPLLAVAAGDAQVRQVYILADGTAWVDLSPEIAAAPAGSDAELATVYAIVDTVALNVREVQRVGFLIDGRTRQTLQGHVAIDRPLAPDYRYLVDSARPAPPGEAAPDAAGSANPPAGAGDESGTGGAGATGDGSGSGGDSGTSGDRGTSGDSGASGDSGTRIDATTPGGVPDGTTSDGANLDDDGRVVVRALDPPGIPPPFARQACRTRRERPGVRFSNDTSADRAVPGNASRAGADPDGGQSDDTEEVDEDDDGPVVVRALDPPDVGPCSVGAAPGVAADERS